MEIWSDVKGYEGFYQVSNTGKVKSLERIVKRSNGSLRPIKEKILCLCTNEDGYLRCKLCRDGKSRTVGVHQLVAEAFIPKPDGDVEVNHKDCNRQNNSVENLEWLSHGDNVRYSISKGNHFCTSDIMGSKNPNYNNHKLAEIYRANPQLAIEKLARLGPQNGRAKAIRATDADGNCFEFDWVGGCAQWLIEIGVSSASVRAIRDRIGESIRRRKPYKGFVFEMVN